MEPTESERTRENLNERLRREFGLAITDEEAPKGDPDEAAPVVGDVDVQCSPPIVETNGYPEGKIDLPQSAIYPVGSSNPPNPFTTPFPAPERRKFRK